MLKHRNKKLKTMNKLGEGTFGAVSLVVDENDVKYALKTVKFDPFTKQQQQKQVEICNYLDHPNIVKVFSDWEDEETLEILMEYCPGGHIGKYSSKKEEPLPATQILKILQQIVWAGLEMNKKGVIHRDLKPQNILLEDALKIKIIDFGCAKKINPTQIYQTLNESYDKGTTRYASPQELRSETYSAKCDIWSVGCIAYELQYNKHPFHEKNKSELIEKIKEISIREILNLQKNTDPRIFQFLRLTLQEKEEERASWEELMLSRIFSPSIQSKQKFLQYLNNLILISKWITKQLKDEKKQLQMKESVVQLFMFFMLKFQNSALLLYLSIFENKSDLPYLFSKDQPVLRNADHIREVKFDITCTQENFEKFSRKIANQPYFKEINAQYPKKRTSCFSDLDFSIRFGKRLLKEKLEEKTASKEKEQWILWMIIGKWVNFQTLLSYQKNPSLSVILKEENDPLAYIRKEFST